jgi:hypothetical protein
MARYWLQVVGSENWKMVFWYLEDPSRISSASSIVFILSQISALSLNKAPKTCLPHYYCIRILSYQDEPQSQWLEEVSDQYSLHSRPSVNKFSYCTEMTLLRGSRLYEASYIFVASSNRPYQKQLSRYPEWRSKSLSILVDFAEYIVRRFVFLQYLNTSTRKSVPYFCRLIRIRCRRYHDRFYSLKFRWFWLTFQNLRSITFAYILS